MVIMLLRDTATASNSEEIIKPTEIQIRSPVGESQCGKGDEVVEMMERRRLELLCVQDTNWRGDRAMMMMIGGRRRLHAGGGGRSSGVGIVISEEISNEVVRVERWTGRVVTAWANV